MVSVLITTFNSATFLERCLESVFRQTYHPIEVVVVDNASEDGTRAILERFSQMRVLYNDSNRGFAAAQNQAAHAANGEWLLSLNPDVILDINFVLELVRTGEQDSRLGTVCGKLLRWNPHVEQPLTNTIDSTGIYFRPDLRHLDRGADQLDTGQYDRDEYVFGATGAAALYRRTMLNDIAVEGEYFDERFFAYREDADLAWRAQLMGWHCVYTPKAVGWHVRRVTPERRKQLPREINWHSIKNRFLMRAKNISLRLYARCFLQTTLRDAQVIGYCLLADQRLASALVAVWTLRRELSRKRQIIQARRRVTDAQLGRWFSGRPTGFPYSSTSGQKAVSQVTAHRES
jgi:GT2 family glycosyltransferase